MSKNGHQPDESFLSLAHDPDVALKDKQEIAANELRIWKNTRWQSQFRLRVQQRLKAHEMGNDAMIQSLTKELEEIEVLIDLLQEEIDALDATATPLAEMVLAAPRA